MPVATIVGFKEAVEHGAGAGAAANGFLKKLNRTNDLNFALRAAI